MTVQVSSRVVRFDGMHHLHRSAVVDRVDDLRSDFRRFDWI